MLHRRVGILLAVVLLLLATIFIIYRVPGLSEESTGKSTVPTAEAEYKEDFNGDGKTNISDAIALLSAQRDGTLTPVEPELPEGIVLLDIPGGIFQMGSNWEDDPTNPYRQQGYFSDEQPVHTVTISAFDMAQTEITQAQYEAVMGTNPSYFIGNNSRPVETVDWYDAVTFCNKLSEAAGLEPCYDLRTSECDFTKNGFRLPTEAEWEYACRAGTTTRFYTGDSDSDLDRAGWYWSNRGSTTHHEVGGKETNAFGLYDMHGNVWEWCNDRYSSNYYSSSPSQNPTGPESGSSRVRRGGGWDVYAYVCHSANRLNSNLDYRYPILGFRVVRGSISPGLQ